MSPLLFSQSRARQQVSPPRTRRLNGTTTYIHCLKPRTTKMMKLRPRDILTMIPTSHVNCLLKSRNEQTRHAKLLRKVPAENDPRLPFKTLEANANVPTRNDALQLRPSHDANARQDTLLFRKPRRNVKYANNKKARTENRPFLLKPLFASSKKLLTTSKRMEQYKTRRSAFNTPHAQPYTRHLRHTL